jgi:hypothetical protein
MDIKVTKENHLDINTLLIKELNTCEYDNGDWDQNVDEVQVSEILDSPITEQEI